MMLFDKILEDPDKKGLSWLLRAIRYCGSGPLSRILTKVIQIRNTGLECFIWLKNFSLFLILYLPFFWRFFPGSGFFGSDQDFIAEPDPNSGKRPIRIRTMDPDPKHWIFHPTKIFENVEWPKDHTTLLTKYRYRYVMKKLYLPVLARRKVSVTIWREGRRTGGRQTGQSPKNVGPNNGRVALFTFKL